MKLIGLAAAIGACLLPLATCQETTERTCETVTLDFKRLPDRSRLRGGEYLHAEWFDTYGLIMSASGGFQPFPRVFNTRFVGNREYGDADLGSPNKRCPKPGPGRGEGGEPDQPGANCVPQGNVLIIQEDNDDTSQPDDQRKGGTITFDFYPPVAFFDSLGLLDMQRPGNTITVEYETDSTANIDIEGLGNNAVQEQPINLPNVSRLSLNLRGSGAITSLKFCYEGTEAPAPPPPPTLPPDCTKVVVDFDTLPDGTPLAGGTYLEEDWFAEYGLKIPKRITFDQAVMRPIELRLFNTSDVGDGVYGDPDLGSPNSRCSNPGPGRGSGGKPGKKGENCKQQGNVLIIQEQNGDKTIHPDDRGGPIEFQFTHPAAEFYEIGLMDIDEWGTRVVFYYSANSFPLAVNHLVEGLGNNAVQVERIDKANVSSISLRLSGSGAITHLSFCYKGAPLTPESTEPPTQQTPNPEPTIPHGGCIGTFSALDDALPLEEEINATIEICPGTIFFDHPITANNLGNVTLTCPGGNCILDGRNETALFYLFGKELNFRGLTLRRANPLAVQIKRRASSDRRASFARFDNCTFVENWSEWQSALVLQGNRAIVQDCIFVNNTSKNNGGAVRQTETDVDFVGCRFLQNLSEKRGGAVFQDREDENSPGISYTDCIFQGNVATRGDNIDNSGYTSEGSGTDVGVSTFCGLSNLICDGDFHQVTCPAPTPDDSRCIDGLEPRPRPCIGTSARLETAIMNDESDIELCDGGVYEIDYSLDDKYFIMKCRGDDCVIDPTWMIWMVGSNNERGRAHLAFVGITFQGSAIRANLMRGSAVRFEKCSFIDGAPGVVLMGRGRASFVNSTFSSQRCFLGPLGRAAILSSSLSIPTKQYVFEHCFFRQAGKYCGDEGPGGSVLLNGTPASFDRCVFYRSYSRSYGGAVAQVVSSSTPLLQTKFSRCDFIENKAGVLGDNIAVIRATGFGEENSIEAFEVVPDGDNYIDCTLTNEFCDGSNTPFALRDKCSLVTSSPICPSNN